MELTKRQRTILHQIVEVYVHSGLPVSSDAVARAQRGRRVSSATIRKVMKDLEGMGVLTQPHARAGRVPTLSGLRTYVDQLMTPKLHPWDRTHLEEATEGHDPHAIAVSLGQRLSGISGQLAVVAVPRLLKTVFKEIGLSRVSTGRFAAWFISTAGAVQQKLVEVDFDLSGDELQRIQTFLNRRLSHRTLPEVRELIARELQDDAAHWNRLRHSALHIGLRALPEAEVDLVIEGTSHVAKHPEFAEVERLQGLLKTIEEKDTLVKLLDRILASRGVEVMLGAEHDISGLEQLACVGTACPSNTGAAVSLVGPVRMDYERLVPMVGLAAELLGQSWKRE